MYLKSDQSSTLSHVVKIPHSVEIRRLHGMHAYPCTTLCGYQKAAGHACISLYHTLWTSEGCRACMHIPVPYSVENRRLQGMHAYPCTILCGEQKVAGHACIFLYYSVDIRML